MVCLKRQAAFAFFLAAAVAAQPARADDPATETHHTVKAGETIDGVAKRAGVDRVLVIEANALKAPYRLRAGQRLIIPRQTTYVVKAGDTGFGVAYQHGVTWLDIAVANGIDPARPLRVGQKLIIPAQEAGEFPPAKAAPPPAPKPNPKIADRPAFAWPAPGKLRRGFFPSGSRGAHSGIDIAGEEGSPVRAAAKGKVVFAGEEPKRYGMLVIVDHGNGWFSAYAKLQKVTVKKGERVRAGERVGLLGHTGETPATELHFEVRRDTIPQDPVGLLPPRD